MHGIDHTCHPGHNCTYLLTATHPPPLQVHQEVRSKRSVAIHCCTFALASESLDEPVLLLEQEAAAAGLQPGEFVTLKHGGLIQTSAGTDRNVPAVMKLA